MHGAKDAVEATVLRHSTSVAGVLLCIYLLLRVLAAMRLVPGVEAVAEMHRSRLGISPGGQVLPRVKMVSPRVKMVSPRVKNGISMGLRCGAIE